MKFTKHCAIGLIIRLSFIYYGTYQDAISEVQYTDVDYKVFTDAARYLLNGESPYKRHAYRYSPIIGLFLLPNLLIHLEFGKFLFSVCDIFSTYFIYKILRLEGCTENESIKWSLFWLYNPLSIIITTRGNADSLAALLVLATLYLYKKDNLLAAGIVHGLAVHFRLYPIVFSLPLYTSVIDLHSNKIISLFYPNKMRLTLVFSCIVSLLCTTGFFYLLYGNEFIDGSLLYHLKRFDIRHNYSVYFYLQYLSYKIGLSEMTRYLMLVPQAALLLLLTVVFGTKRTIAFCEMCMAFILVMFNSVVTCQYFVWYMSLLPLCLKDLNFGKKELFLVSNYWFTSQAAWLLPAYLLEFKSQDTFLYIWIQCLVFFWANIVVLTSLVRNYVSKHKVN